MDTTSKSAGSGPAKAEELGSRIAAAPDCDLMFVCTADACLVHTGPSTKATALGQLNNGETRLVISADEEGDPYGECGGGNTWSEIEWNDGVGWVARSCGKVICS